MRRSTWRVAGLAVLAVVVLATAVQAQQPTVVFSIRGIDAVLDDADFVGEEVGQEDVKSKADSFLELFTGGKGLAGIDRTKPLGIYWNATAAGPQTPPVLFVPVSDADDLKELITMFAPDLDEDDDGTWSANVGGNKVSGKVSGGYLFISPDLPEKLADPAKIANAKYDVALDVSVAGLPAELKEQFLQQIEAQAERSQENLPDAKNEAEKMGREWGQQTSLAMFKSIVNDGDKITIGVDVDEKSRLGTIEFGLTGKAGSGLATALAAYGKIQPAFAGLGSETAPFRMVVSHPVPASAMELDSFFASAKSMLHKTVDEDEKLDTDTEKTAAKGLLDKGLAIALATAKTGALHSAFVLESGDENPLFIEAIKVANGEEAGKLVDEVVKLSKDDPRIGKVKLDAAKHGGARIHEVEVDDENAEEMFGEDPLHLAFRADSMWISLGEKNLDALKKALEAKPAAKTTTSPISLQAKPAALIVLVHGDDSEEDIVESAKEIAGKPGDKLNIDIAPTAGGVKLRIVFGIELLGFADQSE